MADISERSRARTRDEVMAILRRHIDDARRHHATGLFLYGSAARDELTEDSDVDVFIDYDPDGPISFVDIFRLGHLLETALGRKVDIGTREGLHHRLRTSIERSSIRVY